MLNLLLWLAVLDVAVWRDAIVSFMGNGHMGMLGNVNDL